MVSRSLKRFEAPGKTDVQYSATEQNGDFIEQTLSDEESSSTSHLQSRITSQAYEKEEKIRISKISLWLRWKSRNGEEKEQIDQQVGDNVGICN
ncbi:hypothetical protein LINPERHAP1_LOCUS7798 [Linum perenne]